MKKYLLILVAAMIMVPANAQFWNRLGRAVENAAKDAAVKQAERVTENAIDRAVEGAEDAAVDATTDAINDSKNKDKKSKDKDGKADKKSGWTCPSCGTKGNTGKFCNECGAKKPEPSDGTWTCPACGTKGNTGKFCNECGAKKPEAGGNAQHSADEQTAQQTAPKENTRATSEWNKFDFVPGDEVIFYDQLENEQLGEFPSKWELIEGEAEIQRVNGENVIALMEDAHIMPLIEPMWNYLPDVYTIEFDYYEFLQKDGEDYGEIRFVVMPEDEHSMYYELWRVEFDNFISESSHSYYNDDSKTIQTHFTDNAITTGRSLSNENKIPKVEFNKWHHISISVNKRAVKIYYDETRVANIPNYKNPNGGYFGFHYAWAETQYPLYIKNVRFAKGAKPLYDRIVSMVGIKPNIHIKEPGSIQRSTGKQKHVNDKRNFRD